MTASGPRVLVLSRSYPNNVLWLHGLWVKQLVAGSLSICEPKVVAPVPWCPPLPRLPAYYASFRRVERSRSDGGVEVLHPRFLVGPGLSLRSLEGLTYYAGLLRHVARVRKRFPFDVVHAHFTFPDGVAAALIGRRYGVPVVITEHAPWGSWVDDSPLVRRQMLWAARRAAALVAVSRSVKASIERLVEPRRPVRVIPAAVDSTVFTLPQNGSRRDERQLLFAGIIRHVKGVDVLLQAMRRLVDDGADLRLALIGEAYYAGYRVEEDRLRAMTTELGLDQRVRFLGGKAPLELARAMQQSALLVLPSRAESLGMVLVEALACGTPVVATRCGGPEDIVDDHVGLLVTPEDADALADGIKQALDRRDAYEPAALRAHALERFGLDSVTERYAHVYTDVLAR